eukprot:COSAG02_NODE_1788_length_10924_cov_15.455150_11_plen_397_part_00
MQVLDLCGSAWSVHAVGGPAAVNCSAKVNATVPGDIYTDLHAAGVIDDPLGAFGDWKTAWAGRSSWTYTRSFVVTEAQHSNSGSALLVLEGVETNATVILNGQPLLNVSDSWLSYSVEVRQHLHTGANTLEVRFTSVYDVCEFTDPFHSNVSCPGRVYVRQAASSWGWDWAKRYSPQGIWRPVYIAFIPQSKGAVTALSAIVHSAVGQPALSSSFSVEVRLTVYASSTIPTADVEVTGCWSGANNSVTITAALSQGENQLSVQLQAKDVELWWPAGYGKQTMYNLTATVDGSKMTRQIGFRTSWLQTDSGVAQVGESSGSGNTSMVLVVNGQRVLVRGSSLVPLDTFNGRTSAAATRRMLLSVLRGGMNGLRVWGGGTFLPPMFYEMCVTAALLLL